MRDTNDKDAKDDAKTRVDTGGGNYVGGDVNTGGGDFVGRDKIIRIGTLNVPVWMLAVLAALIIVIGGVIIWRVNVTNNQLGGFIAANPTPTPGPTKMTGAFNVAVARFADATPTSDDGSVVSKWVFDKLKTEQTQIADADVKTDILLWHDSLPANERGTTIGTVSSKQTAAQLADRINAQVLIYGDIDAQRNLVPRLYVAPQLSATLSGNYRMGDQPIVLDMAESDSVKRQVTSRTDAMFWMTLGLRQDRNGFMDAALVSFTDAVSQVKSLKVKVEGVEGVEGVELLYYFKGRAALYLANQKVQQDLNTAEFEPLAQTALDAFNKGLAVNPKHVLSQIGVADVWLSRAQRLDASVRMETPDLETALAAYDKAVASAATSSEPHDKIDAQIALGIGQSLQGETLAKTEGRSAALIAFGKAIANLESSRAALAASEEHRLLGEIDQSLGVTYLEQGQSLAVGADTLDKRTAFTKAKAAFAACKAEAKASPRDNILVNLVAAGCERSDAAVDAELKKL